ncbi:MAG: plasmid pRiA4b ORF-3 family protein [Cyanothece sp. SIO2G6]|nr:plasmid pRiA4b ORF-3 family protein [Cyanothece sp. SIO2G6]
MSAIQNYYYPNLARRSESDPNCSPNELQPLFQPYFPEWQQSLGIVRPESHDGVYVFKVTLHEAVRWIAMSSDQSLFELSQLILEAVKFDNDHLDLFRYRLPSGGYTQVHHPYSQESPSSDEVLIRDLGLTVGGSLTYIFDFGDNWRFDVQIEAIDEGDRRSNYTEVIRSEGTAPEQYPDPC